MIEPRMFVFVLFYDSFGYDSQPSRQLHRRIVMRSKHLGSFSVSTLAITAVLLVPLFVSAQTASNKVPLTHEAMWMMKRIGAPVPSPDGKWVVFSLVEPAYDDKDQ